MKFINKNGIYLFPRENAPLSIRLIFNAGSRYDTVPGTAHFLEHMLVAGTKKFPSKDKLADQLEKIGGQFSATTSTDYVWITIDVAEKDDLQTAIDVFEEILTNSLFDQTTLEKERGAIVTEYMERRSNPAKWVWNVYQRLFFQNTPLDHSPIGTLDSVKKISKADIISFFDTHIKNKNAVCIASGDMRIENLERLFESRISLISRSAAEKKDSIPIYKKVKVDNEYFDSDLTHVLFGYRTHAPTPKEEAALYVLQKYICIGRSSKLISELRYRRGLIYSITGHHSTTNDWGTWTIQTSCAHKNVKDVIEISKSLVEESRVKLLDQRTLEQLKSSIRKSLIIKLQTSQSIASYNQEGLLRQTPYTISDYLDMLQTLTPEDIMSAAYKHLLPDDLLIAMCGPDPFNL